MSKEDLIPANKRSPEYAFEIRSRGGKSKSPLKSFKAKLRQIRVRVKKGQLKTEDEAWLLERATNSETMALDMLSFFDEIRKDVHPAQRVALLNTYAQIKKTIHGETHINKNLNVNIDLDVELEELDKHILEVVGK